jgi:hypothetical protein
MKRGRFENRCDRLLSIENVYLDNDQEKADDRCFPSRAIG